MNKYFEQLKSDKLYNAMINELAKLVKDYKPTKLDKVIGKAYYNLKMYGTAKIDKRELLEAFDL